jgi:hypothetical protein
VVDGHPNIRFLGASHAPEVSIWALSGDRLERLPPTRARESCHWDTRRLCDAVFIASLIAPAAALEAAGRIGQPLAGASTALPTATPVPSSVPGPGALHARPHVRHEGATKGNVEGLKRGNGANARAESASILDATVSMAPTFVSRKMFIQLIYWPSGLV